MGRPDEAIQSFARALELQPASPKPRPASASASVARRSDEAIRQYDAVIAAASIRPRAQQSRRASVRSGQTARSHRPRDRALRQNPDFAEAHNNLGNALLETGRLDEAVRHYQEALRLKPGYAVALNNLAGALKARARSLKPSRAIEAAIRPGSGLSPRPQQSDHAARLLGRGAARRSGRSGPPVQRDVAAPLLQSARIRQPARSRPAAADRIRLRRFSQSRGQLFL